MRAAVVTILAVGTVALAGCSSSTMVHPVGIASVTAAPTTSAAPSTAADDGLVAAQYPQCDRGQAILDYLASGNNGGNPSLDQQFASYVGVPKPQARALADHWIEVCDEQVADAAASASSSSASASSSAAASASQAQQDAQAAATARRSCAAVGGEIDSTMGGCHSTVQGNPSGRPGADCAYAWVYFASDGTLSSASYETNKEVYPGCFK